jgi:hypothetical protein
MQKQKVPGTSGFIPASPTKNIIPINENNDKKGGLHPSHPAVYGSFIRYDFRALVACKTPQLQPASKLIFRVPSFMVQTKRCTIKIIKQQN